MSIEGNVVITGGTGSLGTALLRRGFREGWDWRPKVYSRDEVKQAALRAEFPRADFALGDVADRGSLTAAFWGADVVVHAAALKRVPEAEKLPTAYIRANVEGSQAVAAAASMAGVPRVIGISTDKACAPTGVYGATKLLMERVFQAQPGSKQFKFTLVRYGNVLGSRGSVVPLWRKQAETGGPITITDPEMTRFWITMDDALDLIEDGLNIEHGQILVPPGWASDMGTLAEAVAPGASMVTVGTRGGERQHERLVDPLEDAMLAQLGRRTYYVIDPAGVPAGIDYTSKTAIKFTALQLRQILEAADRGETVRTLW